MKKREFSIFKFGNSDVRQEMNNWMSRHFSGRLCLVIEWSLAGLDIALRQQHPQAILSLEARAGCQTAPTTCGPRQTWALGSCGDEYLRRKRGFCSNQRAHAGG